MYQDVLFGETIMETISLLPTLTRSQGMRNCLFTMGVLAQDFLYVNIMCAKFQDQTSYTTKYIHNGGHTHWYMLAQLTNVGSYQMVSHSMLVDFFISFSICMLGFEICHTILSTYKSFCDKNVNKQLLALGRVSKLPVMKWFS